VEADLLEAVLTQQAIAAKWGVSENTVSRRARQFKGGVGINERRQSLPAGKARLPVGTLRVNRALANSRAPTPQARLKLEVREALADFDLFRRRYFGRLPTPWQAHAAVQVRDLLATQEEEYVVVNVPPAAGKSTLFTHDVVCWLICRDRSIRIMIGSRTMTQAKDYLMRLRRTLERTSLAPVGEAEIAKGRAVRPEGVLAYDFGGFRPGDEDLWNNQQFVVVQADHVPSSEKEPTVSAYGADSGFLGGRYDLVIWDDLVDRKNFSTAEQREKLISWWENEAETRLEPGGLLVLQGQRLHSADLYRYALDQKRGEDEEDAPLAWYVGDDARETKYRHIVYKAHYPENCRPAETHAAGAEAYDPFRADEGRETGCLLDPKRIPWRKLAGIRANREAKYRVLFQQEDVDPANVLVPKLWVDGGRDPETGEEFPGCWDKDRGLADPPKGLTPPVYSVVTADPSPSRFWAVAWWLFHPASEQIFLLDLARQTMSAGEFLDWNHATGAFTGLAEEWQARSVDLGFPITHWIVEANAAQRFILQYDHARRWQAKHRLNVVAHQTQRHNRESDEYGIQSIASWFRFGRMRLPGKQGASNARLASLRLVDEVTRWPDGTTDDCVMACWFLCWNIPRLWPRTSGVVHRARRPTWVTARPRGFLVPVESEVAS
jgi:hypothetical protein